MGFGQAAEQLSQVLYAFGCVNFVLCGEKKNYDTDIPSNNTISS